MQYLDYLVDKHDDLILQALGGLSKLPDADNTENHLHALSRHHDVHEVLVSSEVLGNHAGAKLSETTLQKVADFVDGLLEDHSFHLRSVRRLLHHHALRIITLDIIRLLQRVLCKSLDDRDDLLDRVDHNALCII